MSYAASDAEAFESEGFESEAFGELGEAARRGRLPRTASGRGLAPAPQSQQSRNYVTYAALRQAMDKVGAQIKTNSDAISNVGTKLNSTAAALRKEFDERKKETDTIRNDTNQKVSMLALLPLIMTPPTYTIPSGAVISGAMNAGNTQFTTSQAFGISPPSTSMTNALLPLLLVGGLGGTGGSGSTGGMDNTMLLVMALVLANPGH